MIWLLRRLKWEGHKLQCSLGDLSGALSQNKIKRELTVLLRGREFVQPGEALGSAPSTVPPVVMLLI